MTREEPGGDGLEELVQQLGKPGEPDYHNNLGNLYRVRGQLDACIAEYREAVRLNPSDEMFHCNLAIALVESGASEEALSEFEEALRLNPSDYHSHFSLGNLLSKLDRADEAIVEYGRAVDAAPERPEAHFKLATRCYDQDRFSEAVVHYEKAIAAGLGPPASADAHLRLGAIALEAKEWENAEKHLLAAVEVRPDDFMTNYCLAVLYLNIDWGQMNWAARGKAVVFAQKVIELNPSDDDAKQVAMGALVAYEELKPPELETPDQSSPGKRRWWQFGKKP